MKKFFKYKKKLMIALLVVAVGGIVYTGNTFAFFHDLTNPIENNLSVKNLDTEVVEKENPNFSIMEKEPKIINKGKSDVLVRARIIISPESKFNENFGLIGLDNNGWYYNKNDGFYYYEGVLKGTENANNPKYTSSLFTNIGVKIDNDIVYFNDNKVNDETKKKLDGIEITIYHEAIPSKSKIDGDLVDAFEDGNYNQGNANRLWSYFDGQ